MRICELHVFDFLDMCACTNNNSVNSVFIQDLNMCIKLFSVFLSFKLLWKHSSLQSWGSVVKYTFNQACKLQNFCSSTTCSQAPHSRISQHWSLSTALWPPIHIPNRVMYVTLQSTNHLILKIFKTNYIISEMHHTPSSRTHVQIYQVCLSTISSPLTLHFYSCSALMHQH